MEIILRAYQPDDLTSSLALIKTAFKEHEGVVDPPPSAATKTAKVLKDELAVAEAIVAEANGQLVGFVMFEVRDNSVYLGRLSVLPECRGRGVARLLLEQVEMATRRARLNTLELSVRVCLKRQQAIYRHWGFSFKGYGTHPGYSAPTFIKMTKRLSN